MVVAAQTSFFTFAEYFKLEFIEFNKSIHLYIERFYNRNFSLTIKKVEIL